MRYDKILQIIPNTTNTEAVVLADGEKMTVPVVCWGLRYSLEDKGTEDEWENYEVVGMTYWQYSEPGEFPGGKQYLIFVDEDQNERYKFLGYT